MSSGAGSAFGFKIRGPGDVTGSVCILKVLRFALWIVMITGWMSPVSAHTLEQFHARYLESIATADGQAYEALAQRQIWGDLDFLPRCLDRIGVSSGVITVYYEVNANGQLGELFMRPDTELAECVREHVSNRSATPPPAPWVGRVVLTISR